MAYKDPAEALLELAKYFTSGNHVPVDAATIKAKDFWEITGLNPERFVKKDLDDPSTIPSRVAKVLNDFLGCPVSQVMDPDLNLVTEFDLDSLDSVELVMLIEDEFSIEIPDEKVEGIRTVKDIYLIVKPLLSQISLEVED